MTNLSVPGAPSVRLPKPVYFINSRIYLDDLILTGRPRPRANTAIGVALADLIAFDPAWWTKVVSFRPDWGTAA